MFALSKVKAFTDDKVSIANLMIPVCDWVGKHFGKRRKCWLPAFSPFPAMFSKAFFTRVMKTRDCFAKSYVCQEL